uniref:Ig-like domain-containing protein n=1 Tax=Meloidogyne floridensis TaxID=298350 RepID=A0A915NT45_9BILA
MPPQLLPLEGQQSPIRIALGTKGFKLSCPVRTSSEEEWGHNNHQINEETNLENELIIKWSRDGRALETGNNGHYNMANGNRDLWILQARSEDSGLYRCTAINEWGHQSVEFRLHVFDPTNTVADVVRSSESPLPIQIRVNKGKHIQLQCPTAHGNPLPRMTWLRLTGHSEQELGQTSHLSFDRVRPQDAGIYACRLENNLGAIRADFSLQIVEQEESEEKIFVENNEEKTQNLPSRGSISSSIPSHMRAAASNVVPPSTPKIDVLHGQQKLHVGNTAELQCRVEWRGERDKTVIRWLRQLDNADVNAVKAKAPNSSLLKLGQITLLMIEQEEEPDSGRYFCVVTNPAGQFVYRSINISVVDSNSLIPSTHALLNLYLSQSPLFRALTLCLLGLFIIGFIPLIGWLFCVRIYNNGRRQQKLKEKFSEGKNQKESLNQLPNTLTSSSSTSATNSNNNTKITNINTNNNQNLNQNLIPTFPTDPYFNNNCFLPPPPRIPPPILPVNNSTAVNWPSSLPMQASTLERYVRMNKPQMLHRTRADEEMSKISSHIYASGSPLPISVNYNNPRMFNNQLNFNEINNPLINKGQNININKMSGCNKLIEEQRRPLIEAYRQVNRAIKL